MPRRTVALACVMLLIAASAAFAQPVPNKKRKDLLRVSFIDVGQGDSVWIQGPIRHDGKDGINILIDGGPVAQDNDETLIHYLESYGFKKGSVVDCMILTHPHDDHSGGLVNVLKDYDVKMVIDAGYDKARMAGGKTLPYGHFMNAVENEQGAEYVALRKRPKFDLKWGYESSPDTVPAIEATILSAYFDKAKELGNKDNTKENNASTVVRLKFGEVSFLFMGDAEGKDRANKPDTSKYVEKLLVEAHETNQLDIRSTVLKVGHHGSETSSTHDFMDAVHPEVLVVMSGRKKFGSVFLPDDTVLDRYEDRIPGITIVRTDRDDTNRGTINDADGDHVYMYTDGETLRVYEAMKIGGKWKWVLKANVQPDTDDDPS